MISDMAALCSQVVLLIYFCCNSIEMLVSKL